MYGGEEQSVLDAKQRILILKMPPQAAKPDMYYWHLGARALAAREGSVPTGWYGALVRSATALRDPDGSIRPDGPWGEEGGRKGFYVMNDSWFDEYMFEVAIHRDHLPAELREAEAVEPIVLPPWDPMGSLAGK